MISNPDRTEAAGYYFTYIDQAPPGDIRDLLSTQLDELLDLFFSVHAEQSLHRYAAGKWNIREVVCHLIDTERLFVYRALWFARGFDSALPGFDQEVAIAAADASRRSWVSLIEEFRAVRAGTILFFQTLPREAWARRGVASGNEFTVRALAYLAVGHVAHHARMLRERYLVV